MVKLMRSFLVGYEIICHDKTAYCTICAYSSIETLHFVQEDLGFTLNDVWKDPGLTLPNKLKKKTYHVDETQNECKLC